jgi:MerR HTH family regulatory protein
MGPAVTPEADLLRRLARASGLSQTEVRRFLQLGVVTFTGEPVQPALLRRLRRVRRMRRDLGLSLDAIAIIVRLLDRLEAVEGRTPPANVSITVLEDL